MLKQLFKEQDLPFHELQTLGLAVGRELRLDEDDKQALLAGRRTEMLRLENISLQGLQIPALDTKLSLTRNADGTTQLLAHPIYKEAQVPSFLTDTEAEALEKGELTNIGKVIDENGVTKDVLIEFDKETNEFLVIDTDEVHAPEAINGINLSPEQKERYRKGKEVESGEGTTFQYTATGKHAIRSDKIALIASVLIDGGDILPAVPGPERPAQ